MTEESYRRIEKALRARPGLMRFWLAANSFFSFAGYLIYPLLLLLCACTRIQLLLPCFFVPCAGFVLISILRCRIDAKRPYELYGFTPLIEKDTAGKSFPSRHVFSMFAIACAWWQYCLPVAVVCAIAGLFMAISRVIGGVHFPKDVIAGCVMALLLSAFGYALML